MSRSTTMSGMVSQKKVSEFSTRFEHIVKAISEPEHRAISQIDAINPISKQIGQHWECKLESNLENEKWTWNLSVAMIQKDKHTQKSLRDHVAQVKFTAINLGRGKHLDTTEILLNKQNEWTGGLSLNVTLWTAEHGLKLVVEITMFHRFIKEPLPIAKLRDMLAGNMTLDTRFLAFSKRLHNEGGDHGKTCAAAPRAVFANSDLLVSSSPYFKAMLKGEFADAASSSIKPAVFDFSGTYDYQSDSDLDSDDDIDEVLPSESSTRPAKKQKTEAKVSHALQLDDPRVHTVQIKDTAYRTWAALIFYLHTQEITFATLKSLRVKDELRLLSDYSVSPKSMYRLADKLGIDDLTKQSLNAIRRQLNASNVARELFSDFATQHPAVRAIAIEVALGHWSKIKSLPIMQEEIKAAREKTDDNAGEIVLEIMAGLSQL